MTDVPRHVIEERANKGMGIALVALGVRYNRLE